MQIYTKTGDQGETSLYGGKRVSKGALRLESYGTVDELNAHVGLLRDLPVNEPRKPLLKTIQDLLFTLGSHLAADPEKGQLKKPDILESDVTQLEAAIDEMDALLEPLQHFVLPGGHLQVSQAHVARTVCRRAERCVVRLQEEAPVPSLIIQYLNRLSDYLFVLSRMMAKELNAEEVKWEPRSSS